MQYINSEIPRNAIREKKVFRLAGWFRGVVRQAWESRRGLGGIFLCVLGLVGLVAVGAGLWEIRGWEAGQAWAFQSARGELELTVVDPAIGKPIPCRIHLRRSKGRPWRPEDLPFWHDHFVFPGQVRLKLPLGTYEFEIERGPEYAVRSGYFTIQRDSNDTQQVELPRFVDMASEGWYAGDLLVARPAKEMPLLLETEDLFLAVRAEPAGAKTAEPPADRSGPASPPRQHPPTGLLQPTRTGPAERLHRPGLLLENSGGTYLLVPLDGRWPILPAPSKPSEKSLPQEKDASKSSADKAGGLGGKAATLSEVQLLHLLEAKASSQSATSPEADAPSQPARYITPSGQQTLWMDVVWPYSWDLPLWLALGKVDSVEVLHSHFRRNEWLAEEKEGRRRDMARFPGRWGHGLWGQYIYFQILECGVRLSPSAGSASGLCPNPVGYNRVYVHLEGPPSWQTWWEAFRQGRVMVTNGPLVRLSVEGKPPGHEFTAPEGQKLELELALSLSTREKVPYLEIIQNGKVAHSVSFEQYQKSGRLPKLTFEQSGWFLVRAMAETPPTYRLAMTGPYYVRIGPQRRISRSAVQFFLTWLQEREAMLQKQPPLATPELLKAYQTARQFWQDLLRQANAE